MAWRSDERQRSAAPLEVPVGFVAGEADSPDMFPLDQGQNLIDLLVSRLCVRTEMKRRGRPHSLGGAKLMPKAKRVERYAVPQRRARPCDCDLIAQRIGGR